jgi:hypothetical protein
MKRGKSIYMDDALFKACEKLAPKYGFRSCAALIVALLTWYQGMSDTERIAWGSRK